ncbi:hypothetical protein M405DRAFT_936996 [Rhizopogon salebrosus TDB-379]|nr:hypothetical protein M405DRAFT_936996 [Rhizopogon salebrosus TDB-379]
MTPPPKDNYKIKNVAFDTQYADLANGNSAVGTEIMGHHEDDTASGINNRTFELTVIDQVASLVTLKNKTSGTYATINQEKGVVEGGPEQVLQLSTQDGSSYVIHPKDVDFVWILKDKKDWTPITAAAAPADPENKTKYWRFEKV